MGLRFTLSHPVNAAVPHGEEALFRIALNVAGDLKPLKTKEVQMIKEKGLIGIPLFKYIAT